jgi:hypothetical protein
MILVARRELCRQGGTASLHGGVNADARAPASWGGCVQRFRQAVKLRHAIASRSPNRQDLKRE